MTPPGYKMLAAEILQYAFWDMRSTGPLGQRVAAAAWLASSAATIWFEVIGINQARALQEGDWVEFARGLWDEIQDASEAHLESQDIRPHHIRLIRDCLERVVVNVA